MKAKKNNKSKNILTEIPKALALCALGVTSAWANNLTVNSLADTIAPGDSQCTLREAIFNANSDTNTSGGDCLPGSGADTITFTTSGTILLGSTLSVSDAAGLTIDGTGRNIVLNGNNAVQVLHNIGTFTLRNLTVANGFTANTTSGPGGGGIANIFGFLTVDRCTFTGNTAPSGYAGAIYTTRDTSRFDQIPQGNLTVSNSSFSGNSALGGGAIYSTGTLLTVSNSTLNGNAANIGGAIFSSANNTVSNSTFYGNTAKFHGGAFFSAGQASILNSTIVGNSVVAPVCTGICTASLPYGGGIVGSGLYAMNITNSIVAGNSVVIKQLNLPDIVSPSDVSYAGGSGNNNIIGGGPASEVGFQNGVNGNRVGVDVATVVATALANNGGPTQTLALIPGSPAINTALATSCPATDQRGVARPPQGIDCDIGAFETEVSADLAVIQTATPNPVMVSDLLTWTVMVINSGPANATGVTVVDTLPVSGLRSISVTASQGSCGPLTSGAITCNLGDLAIGGTASVTVSALPTATGTLTNQARVSGSQPDSHLANNTATQSVPAQALLCKGVKPTIVGTPGPNTLRGTRGRDVILGLGGNDTITGGSDNDIICGGEGNDSLSGEGGNDSLDGGAGADSCNGGTGTDTGVNCEVRSSIP